MKKIILQRLYFTLFIFVLAGIFYPISARGDVIPKSNWQLVYVNSQEMVGSDGRVVNAFDDEPSTIWHTRWYGGSDPLPHEIRIDLGAFYAIDGFRYLPRQDGSPNGNIGQYEFYVSDDGINWGSPAAAGIFTNTAAEKEVRFTGITGQFIRLRVLTEVNGMPWTSMAELSVLGTLLNQLPDAIINSPAQDLTINPGDTVTFSGTGTDPDNNLPLMFKWSFGAGSGIPDSTAQDPGAVTFSTPGTYTVTLTVTDALGLSDSTPASRVITVVSSTEVIPKSNWQLVYVDSQETMGSDGRAVNGFDGNPATIWHTRWYGGSDSLPHEIRIDLGAFYTIDGFRYLPRQDGVVNGRIEQYEFYVSNDGVNWGTPVATGTFANSQAEKEVRFLAAPGRYVRLRVLTEVNGMPWTSMAELSVFGTSYDVPDFYMPDFYAPLSTTTLPEIGSETPSYSGPSLATVTDFEGGVWVTEPNEIRFGAPRYVGATWGGTRRVVNQLIHVDDLSNAVWLKSGITVSNGTTLTATSSDNYIAQLLPIMSKNRTFVARIRLNTVSGTATASIGIARPGNYDPIDQGITITTTPQVFAVAHNDSWSDNTAVYFILGNLSNGASVVVSEVQMEDSTSVTLFQVPSEYVPSVGYFDYANLNTINPSGVVTETHGAVFPDPKITGYIAEGSRTNEILYSEAFDNVVWVKSNITVTPDTRLGLSGAHNGHTLGATADNATVSQSVTATAAPWTFSVYLLRKYVTGTVSVTADGTNYTPCTTNTIDWVVCTDTRTLTPGSHPMGIKLAAGGDAVYAWGAQAEEGVNVSSYIPTTNAPVTRAANTLTYPVEVDANNTTVALSYASVDTGGVRYLWSSRADADNGAYLLHDGTNFICRKRLGVTTYDATKMVALTPGGRMKAACRFSSTTGIDIWVNGVKGMGNADTIVLQGGSRIAIGDDGNGGNHAFGSITDIRVWKRFVSDIQLGQETR